MKSCARSREGLSRPKWRSVFFRKEPSGLRFGVEKQSRMQGWQDPLVHALQASLTGCPRFRQGLDLGRQVSPEHAFSPHRGEKDGEGCWLQLQLAQALLLMNPEERLDAAGLGV